MRGMKNLIPSLAAPRALTRRDLIPFLAPLLVALVARCLYIYATIDFRLRPLQDNAAYLNRGEYLASHYALMPILVPGHGSYPDAYWPPGFPVMLAMLIKLHSLAVTLWFGKHFSVLLWSRLGMSVVSVLGLAGLALLAYRLFGRRIALIVCWIGALYLPWIDLGASVYSESLFVPLVIATCLAMVEYQRVRRRRWLVAAGLLTGLAAMTHSNGAVLIPIMAVAAWATGRPKPRGFPLRALGPAVIVLAATALVMAPWTIRNEIKLHAFVPFGTSLGNTLAGTYNSDSARASPPGQWLQPPNRPQYKSIFRRYRIASSAEDAALRRRAFQYIGDHPLYLATVAFWNTVRLLDLTDFHETVRAARAQYLPGWSVWVQDVEFWALCMLAIAGAFTRRARTAPLWFWAVPIFLFVSVVWLGTGGARFRSPVDPFLILLAASALEAAWSLIRARAQGRAPTLGEPRAQSV
jgi:4-amino-4-deoxy-L-arabinose transferase-like glycosyltransferase